MKWYWGKKECGGFVGETSWPYVHIAETGGCRCGGYCKISSTPSNINADSLVGYSGVWWHGGFWCTSNMKSYDILDLVSHFSRNDGEEGGRHQDIPDPWCQSHDPHAPGQGSAPRLPMRASPARHKAHEPSHMGWGRVAREHSLWPEYSGIYEIGHLHEESQLRALCFGFAVIWTSRLSFSDLRVCVLCWARLRIRKAPPRKRTWKVYAPYFNSPIKGNIWVCLLLLHVRISKSRWINADYGLGCSRKLDLGYDFPCYQFELLPLCQRYFKRINEGLWRKKALSPTPKWTKLIKLWEPNLRHLLYFVTFYGPKADID